MRRSSIEATDHRKRAAFTLLELLIASVLIATLMAAVWGLMSMYSTFLVAGRNQAAEQQLSRSLMDLVAADLRGSGSVRRSSAVVQISQPAMPSAVSPPAVADAVQDRQPAAAGVEPLPQESFTGDEHMLTLIGRKNEPRFDARRFASDGAMPDSLEFGTEPLPAGSSDGLTPEYAVAPEWTKIIYRFIPPQALSGDDRELPPGLHRFEIPVEFLGLLMRDDQTGSGIDAGPGEAAINRADEFSTEFMDSFQLLVDQQVPGVTHEHIPEVVACRFEYFSGSSWQLNWAPTSEDALPSAVRVSLRILSSRETRELNALLGADDANEQSIDDIMADDARATADPFERFHPRLYRRTILTDFDRSAVRPSEETTYETLDSVASIRIPPEAK